MSDTNDGDRQPDLDAGAYIGRQPELASETIPGGVLADDERVSAGDSQAGTAGEPDAPSGRGEGAEAADETRARATNRPPDAGVGRR
jgi:hypothetical protein